MPQVQIQVEQSKKNIAELKKQAGKANKIYEELMRLISEQNRINEH